MRVDLCHQGTKNWISVHRLVADAFVDNPKNLSYVNHIDGNKQNNRSSNLEWTTPSENILHAYRLGLLVHNYKLSEEEILSIRNSNLPDKEIAEMFGISVSYANKIRKYKVRMEVA